MKIIACLPILILVLGDSHAEETPRERPQRPVPEVIMKEFDRDGDGTLSEQEQAEMREALRERRQSRRKALIDRFDTDGDGRLSETERTAAHDAMHAEMLEKYDADGDGNLDRTERQAMINGEGHHPLRFAKRGPHAGQDRGTGANRAHRNTGHRQDGPDGPWQDGNPQE